MPHFCCVIGCSNKSNKDDKSFFSIRQPIKRQGPQTFELSKERFTKWMAAISREDLNMDNLGSYRICSDHFIKGKFHYYIYYFGGVQCIYF